MQKEKSNKPKTIFQTYIDIENSRYKPKFFTSKLDALKEVEKITENLEYLNILYDVNSIGYIELELTK